MDFIGRSGDGFRRGWRTESERDLWTGSCGDCHFDLPAGSRRDCQGELQRGLQRDSRWDVQSGICGDLDSELRAGELGTVPVFRLSSVGWRPGCGRGARLHVEFEAVCLSPRSYQSHVVTGKSSEGLPGGQLARAMLRRRRVLTGQTPPSKLQLGYTLGRHEAFTTTVCRRGSGLACLRRRVFQAIFSRPRSSVRTECIQMHKYSSQLWRYMGQTRFSLPLTTIGNAAREVCHRPQARRPHGPPPGYALPRLCGS